MYKLVISIALLPAALVAQSVSASAHSTTTARASAGSSTSMGVSSSMSADAEVQAAHDRGLPERPIQRRIAEGRAKGASEARIAASAHQMRVELEEAHDAMIRAGRSNPSDDETERGAYMLEGGYTSAQLETVVRSAPSDRSLVVAFDVLTSLRERGVSSERALAEVQSRLVARSSDESISALASSSTNANAGTAVGRSTATGAASTTGRANAATGAAVSGAAGATSAAGSVTGAVSGVVKKP